MTSFVLSSPENNQKSPNRLLSSGAAFGQFLSNEKSKMALAFLAILINSGSSILTPFLIGKAVDEYIGKRNVSGLQQIVLILFASYLLVVVSGFLQSRLMGLVSQNTLLRLRLGLFEKIQSLPIAFFNQNKAGDLMSRVNNDTDKLNTFLSESIIRFAGNIFVILGIGIFIFTLNVKLALATLIATLVLFIITQFISPAVQQLNKKSLEATGNLSTEIEQSLSNFKVIVAFNRRDYFLQNFILANAANFQANFKAGLINEIFKPIYDLASYFAQILVLILGLNLIGRGEISIGLLIAFLGYTRQFYDPLRMIGALWASIQSSLAAWDRVRQILRLESDLQILPKSG